MTSYLAALATRELGSRGVGQPAGALGPAIAVAPRHVGRYESWAMPVLESAEHDADRGAHRERIATAFDTRRDDTRAAHDTERVETAAPGHTDDTWRPRRGEHEVDVPSVRRPDVPESIRHERAPVAATMPAPVAAPMSAPRPSMTLPRDVVATRVERIERETMISSPSEANAAVAPVSAVAPERRASAPLVVTPRRAEPRAAPSVGVATSRETPPAVVVTIGRIEVRAVSAPASPRAARAAAPAMSLDDYLRERTRGLR